MALKAITLRLDAEEFEKLKENLSKFGDPDINVGYVLRAYIRDINRIFPLVEASGWDLKTFFGFFGLWLKEVASITNTEVLTRGMFNWWAQSFPTSPTKEGGVDETVARKKSSSTAREEGGNKQ